MTVYATNLTQLLTTVRTTLAEKVGPGVSDPGTLLELGMVIEQIDNLVGRTTWSPTGVEQSCELTDRLTAGLGLDPAETADLSADVDGLAARRRAAEQRLRTTYLDGDAEAIASTVAAVAEFSTVDIRDQISVGMRRALPF